MRVILLAMLAVMAVALFGTSDLAAAPLNGSSIGSALAASDGIQPAQHFRRESHFRFGSRPIRRCNVFCRHREFTSRRVCVERC